MDNNVIRKFNLKSLKHMKRFSLSRLVFHSLSLYACMYMSTQSLWEKQDVKQSQLSLKNPICQTI